MMKLLFVSIDSPKVRACGGQDIRPTGRILWTDPAALSASSEEECNFNSQRLTCSAN